MAGETQGRRGRQGQRAGGVNSALFPKVGGLRPKELLMERLAAGAQRAGQARPVAPAVEVAQPVLGPVSVEVRVTGEGRQRVVIKTKRCLGRRAGSNRVEGERCLKELLTARFAPATQGAGQMRPIAPTDGVIGLAPGPLPKVCVTGGRVTAPPQAQVHV
jgi:hypothetical protein